LEVYNKITDLFIVFGRVPLFCYFSHESSYNILVCESENNVNIREIKSQEPSLVKMIDVLGREQKGHEKGVLLFYIYDNGVIEKRWNF